jgi:large subunit ribosomal protein L21
MYAVFTAGGKQFRAEQGAILRVELMKAEPGDVVELGEAMLLADGDNITVGAPLVGGSKVTAKVIGHGRGDKVEIVKFRRRKHYRRQMGHRQHYTEIEITGISGASKKSSDKE